uniref:Uncharacterized protein n=1 Tax=viral metagenome TaxID=1070528 RepID=A0A6C0IDK0_9ZZZZ
MPEIIWKTENNQFDLFKFFDFIVEKDEDYFISYVFTIIEEMNREAAIVFADYTFSDNFWELLDEDKIDYIYRKVIIESIDRLSFAECYNLLYILTYQKWTDEDGELFTFQKLKEIIKSNNLGVSKRKLYYATSDCIVYSKHIENIAIDHFNVIDSTATNAQSSRICYKITLKDNSNSIARCIYEQIGHTKNTDKDLLVCNTNDYILNHLKSSMYCKDDIENVISQYGVQKAIEEFIANRERYDNIITMIDNDISKIYLGVAYYILCGSFEYTLFVRSNL